MMTLHEAEVAYSTYVPGTMVTVIGQPGEWTVIDRRADKEGDGWDVTVHITRSWGSGADVYSAAMWASAMALVPEHTHDCTGPHPPGHCAAYRSGRTST